MLKVWGRCSAFNVQKVMWVVAELGLPHEHIDVGGAFGGLDDPAFLAMNPHGRIPVIDDAGLVVWESHAIIRYLCARYGSGTLWPRDAAERSFADRWMDWSATTLYRYLGLDLARPPIPYVEAWYQRLAARPAYREHVMVPFAELRGRLAF
jgi:glutathione S-transferase